MLAEIEMTKAKDIDNTGTVFLDPDQKSPRAQDFEERLSSRIVGQERAVRRMERLGYAQVEPANPYWKKQGATFCNPDGYRVVLQNAAWPT